MGFFSFVALAAIAYLCWRISDQLPDILFRLSEMQRDVAEIRRRTDAQEAPVPLADVTVTEAATDSQDDEDERTA